MYFSLFFHELHCEVFGLERSFEEATVSAVQQERPASYFLHERLLKISYYFLNFYFTPFDSSEAGSDDKLSKKMNH